MDDHITREEYREDMKAIWDRLDQFSDTLAQLPEKIRSSVWRRSDDSPQKPLNGEDANLGWRVGTVFVVIFSVAALLFQQVSFVRTDVHNHSAQAWHPQAGELFGRMEERLSANAKTDTAQWSEIFRLRDWRDKVDREVRRCQCDTDDKSEAGGE